LLFSRQMKRHTSTKPNKHKAAFVVRTVSFPPDMLGKVLEKISTEPDLNFSQYIRRLIREDLAADGQEAAV
jgi:hypothetical protein